MRPFVRAGVFVVCASAALAFASLARAGTYPNDRNGFMIGFGAGGGSSGIEDGDSRESGVTGNFRIGYAVQPDLVLAFEGNGWTKSETSPIGDLTVTFSTATAALTWYPNAGGGFVRGGLGFGTASAEVDFGGLKVSNDETGFGFLVAAGYEWRLTKKFALGPQAEFSSMSLDQLGSENMVGGSLDFDWFW